MKLTDLPRPGHEADFRWKGSARAGFLLEFRGQPILRVYERRGRWRPWRVERRKQAGWNADPWVHPHCVSEQAALRRVEFYTSIGTYFLPNRV